MTTFDQQPGDPDWDRYLVVRPGSSGGTPAPAGDPIRWGGSCEVQIGGPYPAGLSPLILNSPTFVNAASKDGYSRGWSIIGALRMPDEFWNPAVGTYPAPAPNSINVLIDIALGVGQTTFKQQILLAAGGNPKLGLCNQQSAVNNGPYGELNANAFSSTALEPFIETGSWKSRGFAAIGSVVASTISIRGVFHLSGPYAWPSNAILSVGVSPIAAGEGI